MLFRSYWKLETPHGQSKYLVVKYISTISSCLCKQIQRKARGIHYASSQSNTTFPNSSQRKKEKSFPPNFGAMECWTQPFLNLEDEMVMEYNAPSYYLYVPVHINEKITFLPLFSID